MLITVSNGDNPASTESLTIPKSPASNQFVAPQSRMLIKESNDIMAAGAGGNKKKVTG